MRVRVYGVTKLCVSVHACVLRGRACVLFASAWLCVSACVRGCVDWCKSLCVCVCVCVCLWFVACACVCVSVCLCVR